jgi:hypothetical protein
LLFQSTEVGGQKLDSLLKEEALHNTELQERWEFCLDGESGVYNKHNRQ